MLVFKLWLVSPVVLLLSHFSHNYHYYLHHCFHIIWASSSWAETMWGVEIKSRRTVAVGLPLITQSIKLYIWLKVAQRSTSYTEALKHKVCAAPQRRFPVKFTDWNAKNAIFFKELENIIIWFDWLVRSTLMDDKKNNSFATVRDLNLSLTLFASWKKIKTHMKDLHLEQRCGGIYVCSLGVERLHTPASASAFAAQVLHYKSAFNLSQTWRHSPAFRFESTIWTKPGCLCFIISI